MSVLTLCDPVVNSPNQIALAHIEGPGEMKLHSADYHHQTSWKITITKHEKIGESVYM